MNKETIEKMKIQNQTAMVEIERLSTMLQTSIQALKYISQPSGKTVKLESRREKAAIVAKQAIAKMQALSNRGQAMKSAIEKGDIKDLEPATPPVKRLPPGGEILFTQEHNLLFHQCCQCGLIHEVALEWDIPDKLNQQLGGQLSLLTKWTRRDGPPTEEELVERGFAIKHLENGDSGGAA